MAGQKEIEGAHAIALASLIAMLIERRVFSLADFRAEFQPISSVLNDSGMSLAAAHIDELIANVTTTLTSPTDE